MSTRRLASVSDVPEPLRRLFERLGQPTSPEQALWRAVVERVALDAIGCTGMTNRDDQERTIRDARTWLAFGPNVEEVFDMADVTPRPVVRAVLDTNPLEEFRHDHR